MESVHILVYSRERGEEQIETAQGSGQRPAIAPVCVLVPLDLEQLPGRAMALLPCQGDSTYERDRASWAQHFIWTGWGQPLLVFLAAVIRSSLELWLLCQDHASACPSPHQAPNQALPAPAKLPSGVKVLLPWEGGVHTQRKENQLKPNPQGFYSSTSGPSFTPCWMVAATENRRNRTHNQFWLPSLHLQSHLPAKW